MASIDAVVALRPMGAADLPAVLDAQEAGGVLGLADVFPQDRHPFPRSAIARRWMEELGSADVICRVILRGTEVAGFCATRADEVLHFGVHPDFWGTGVAGSAHDLLLDVMRASGRDRLWLTVFTANPRGRRFWEKHGWRSSGAKTRSAVPPHAELLHYELDLGR